MTHLTGSCTCYHLWFPLHGRKGPVFLLPQLIAVVFVFRCVHQTLSTETTSGLETHSGPNWNQWSWTRVNWNTCLRQSQRKYQLLRSAHASRNFSPKGGIVTSAWEVGCIICEVIFCGRLIFAISSSWKLLFKGCVCSDHDQTNLKSFIFHKASK